MDTDEGWDEAMQLALEEKPNADEDLSDPSQLAAVASATLSNAHRYFTAASCFSIVIQLELLSSRLALLSF